MFLHALSPLTFNHIGLMSINISVAMASVQRRSSRYDYKMVGAEVTVSRYFTTCAENRKRFWSSIEVSHTCRSSLFQVNSHSFIKKIIIITLITHNLINIIINLIIILKNVSQLFRLCNSSISIVRSSVWYIGSHWRFTHLWFVPISRSWTFTRVSSFF